MTLRLVVLALVAFMTLPTVVVVAVSFNPTAIMAFPPAGLSLRWYRNALTYPQFQRAAVNSVWVTLGAALLAVPASAQSTGGIRGTVTDAATSQPIGGVTVSIGSLLAVTHADGTYRLSSVAAGTDTLRARMIGYTPVARVVTVVAG